MPLPTEPIGSIPRPAWLLEAVAANPATHPSPARFGRVISPIARCVETTDEVCNRLLEAAECISIDPLGSTGDRGFSPFADDFSTSRDTAFVKSEGRVRGTALAAARLGMA
jgi:5-methyltetrahydropteroyltriglutamate--homocysteine methyltransferase